MSLTPGFPKGMYVVGGERTFLLSRTSSWLPGCLPVNHNGMGTRNVLSPPTRYIPLGNLPCHYAQITPFRSLQFSVLYYLRKPICQVF